MESCCEYPASRVDVLGGVLAKACADHYEYALKLRTGEVYRFSYARPLSPEWLHIGIDDDYPLYPPDRAALYKIPGPRGMDVRVSDIVWAMDAPEGS